MSGEELEKLLEMREIRLRAWNNACERSNRKNNHKMNNESQDFQEMIEACYKTAEALTVIKRMSGVGSEFAETPEGKLLANLERLISIYEGSN